MLNLQESDSESDLEEEVEVEVEVDEPSSAAAVPSALGGQPASADVAAPAAEATAGQQEDESLVSQTRISVTAMQLGFEQSPAGQQWLRLHLRDTFGQ